MDIPGPVGALEAELTTTADSAGAFAVLCHPHPQYGGNMHDAVLKVLETVLLGSGVACLRFNFRGVGGSDGRYDGNGGEVEDLLAVVAWLRDAHAPRSLVLGGYSFGASIVWQALTEVDAVRALLIAPPTAMMAFEPLANEVPVDIFAGERDEFVDMSALEGLPNARLHPLPGANHFFSGAADALEHSISRALARTA